MSVRNLKQEEKDLGDFLPYISGGKLEGTYELLNVHFHWGDENNRGAEHILNDIQYTMVMHVVHKNKKYEDMLEALNHSDGLAVMACFFELSEFDGVEISYLIKSLPNLKDVNDTVKLSSTFSLHSLMKSIDFDCFYTYKGSLSTPPFSEAVTWVIFPDPLKVSLSQISQFRQVRSSKHVPLGANFRNVQPVGNRRIYVRKVNTHNQPIDKIAAVHHSKYGWFY